MRCDELHDTECETGHHKTSLPTMPHSLPVGRNECTATRRDETSLVLVPRVWSAGCKDTVYQFGTLVRLALLLCCVGYFRWQQLIDDVIALGPLGCQHGGGHRRGVVSNDNSSTLVSGECIVCVVCTIDSSSPRLGQWQRTAMHACTRCTTHSCGAVLCSVPCANLSPFKHFTCTRAMPKRPA